MQLDITLLGERTLALDGRRRALAGAKTWALLGRVVIGPPITRRELATFLWPEANDPRAACRWTILQVRRALEPAATFIDVDDGLRLTALDGATVVVDVLMLHEGRTSIDELGTIGDLLLEGIDPRDAPEFEDWLRRERTRAVSALGATLRWSAAVAATTDTGTAIALARRAIVLDPFDDSGHEVLVSLLVAEGARADAEAHVRLVERRYRDDLGIDMPHVIRRGLDRVPVAGPGVSTPATAEALLEVARSRAESGDYHGAIDVSRRAAISAASWPGLEAQALLLLGGILVHSVRGRDSEAVGLLQRALRLSLSAGDEVAAAEAERELAYIGLLAASYGAAEGLLHRSIARSEAAADDIGAARARVILGACQSDRAAYGGAAATLEQAIATLHAFGDRWEAFALSVLARVRLLTGGYLEARMLGEAAVTRCRESGWLSLAPWPMVIAAEAALCLDADLDHDAAFDHAYALSCELGDPCWEAVALRGKALVARAAGRDEAAEKYLRAGLDRARSVPDFYVWVQASLLTDLVELEGGRDATHVAAALATTRRGPMPDLLDRVLAASVDTV